MVRKEELCDWFQNLHPCKRVDYMCGLLHICLPLELRFIGSVLEDLAKKDFHYLRDAEIKANQLGEFANLNSMLLTDEKLRTKIIIALALLNSSNSSCAENIFEILERQIDNLLTYVHSHHSKQLTDEVHLMLTMAIHHPAFKAYQKTILDDKLKVLEKQNPDFFWYENEADLNLPSRPLDSEISHNVFPTDNQTLICDKPEKVSIVSIEIVGNKDVPHSKKNEISVKEYHIQSKWSNGEIREVYMKPKALHDLHLQLLNQLPEEKKKRKLLPYYPGKANKDELPEKQMQTANEYLRKMAKVLSQIPDCEVFTEPFRRGTLVNQPSSIASTSSNVPQQHKPFIYQTSPPFGDHPTQLNDHNHRQNPLRMFNNFPPTQSSPGPSQLSSTTNSPSNSRTSSPVPQNPSAQSRFKMGPIGSVEMVHSIRPSNIELSLNQLLLLLNLEKYFDNLKEFSIKQVIQMSTEDFAKAGLPADAQDRLRKKLDKLKQTLDSNGITESLSRTSFPESPMYQINCLPPGSPMYMTQQYCSIFHPTPAYTPQPIGLLQSPPGHYQPGEISPANTEAMSPPPSPLQVSGLAADHMQVHPIGHVPLAAGPASLMSSPAAIVAASLGVSDVKILKQPWSQAMDSSGSEEDRGANKIKGRGRPQQSQSLPQISQSAVTVSASDESKMSALPNSLSVPHTHPPLINTEQRTDTPPPSIHSLPTAIVNGYASDPSPHQLQGPPPPLRGIYPALRFKTPQPTHTGQKNLIPMPMSFGMHPPQGIGKNSGSVGPMHPPLHPIHSFINTQTGVPSNQLMMLSQTLQSNSLPLGPQSQQSTLSESANVLYYVPLQPNILTSIANSSAAITTTQSHLTGQPHSHSPAPAANSGAEQVQGAPVIVSSELVDSGRSDGSCLTPPSHTPPHHNILKSQSNASGPDSGTPSPPLPLPSSTKQPGLYYYVVPHQQNNGYVSHMPPLYHHIQQNPQPPPQPLPNGVAPEMYWPGHRFPGQMAPGVWPPFLYGNSVYPPYNPSVNPTVTTNSSSMQTNTSNQAPPSVVASTKSLCYNCGHVGHKASHCEENTMENMSNTFRLNIKPPDYKPKSDSE